MTNQQAQASGAAPPSFSLDAFLQKNERAVGLGLLVAAALFAVIPLVNLIFLVRRQPANMPVLLWGLALAAIALFGGLWVRLREPTREIGPLDGLRLAVLTVGSLAGLVTVILGLWLPFSAWSFAFIPAPPGENQQPVPIIRLWRENAWRITACASAIFFGLALMFASLQLARSAVRTSATMRRLLFGYNSVLTGILLVAILFVINVLAYIPMKPFSFLGDFVDLTPSQIYTLSPASEALLKSLDKSPQVTVLLRPNDPITDEVERLLKNCEKADPRFKWKLIDPIKSPEDFEAELQRARVRADQAIEFMGQPPRPALMGGLVVEYGATSDKLFIRWRDLYQPLTREDSKGPLRFAFRGEREIMKALRKLSEKTPAKIYFTQGNGELDLNDSDRVRFDAGAGLLKEHLLSRGNYEVQELKLGERNEGVPKDANVVVVARPTAPLSSRAITALRAYLKRSEIKDKDDNITQTGGKLVVLLDVQPTAALMDTDLEKLLREYSVDAGNDRLLSVSQELDGSIELTRKPLQITVMADPRSRNPVAQAFSRGVGRRTFTLEGARSIVPQTKGEGGRNRFTVEPLLDTVRDVIWRTSDLATPPETLFQNNRKNRPGEMEKQLYGRLPVAVTVSEGGQSVPSPGHPPIPGKETPRLVVFGDATWVTNAVLARPEGKDYKDLFTSCVTWLRERPDVGIGVPDKVRPVFTLRGKVEEGSGAVSRLYWLPPLFILISILALGGGVWISRRR